MALNSNKKVSKKLSVKKENIYEDPVEFSIGPPYHEEIELPVKKSIVKSPTSNTLHVHGKEYEMNELRDIVHNIDAVRYLGMVIDPKMKKEFTIAHDVNSKGARNFYRSKKCRMMLFCITLTGGVLTVSASLATLLCKYIDADVCGHLDKILGMYQDMTNNASDIAV